MLDAAAATVAAAAAAAAVTARMLLRKQAKSVLRNRPYKLGRQQSFAPREP